MTDRKPTVTSVTRRAAGSYPIMSRMLAVTQLRLFLLSVTSARSSCTDILFLFIFFSVSEAFSLSLLGKCSCELSSVLKFM